MKKVFVAVVGWGNSGKSTLIASLTGCKSPNFRGEIIANDSQRWMWVSATSPEELYISLKDFKKELSAAASDPLCTGIVMAIQPTQPWKKLSLEQIYGEVDSSGAFDNFAFLMDPGYKGRMISVPAVRSRIKSVSPGTTIRSIDGRKFGFLNAEYIQKMTGIVW